MKISVIIPVFNATKTLVRAIQSVLRQEEVDEVIVVDDGSKDDSAKLVQDMQLLNDKIKFLTHPLGANKGPSATRNMGIKEAKNEWIAFLDADDYYLENRFYEVVKKIKSNSNIDGVYDTIQLEGDDNKKIGILEKNILPENLFSSMSPLGNAGQFTPDGFVVRKTLLIKAGLFNEEMHFGEDILLWFKCALLGRLVQGSNGVSVAVFSRDGNNMTHNVEVKRYLIPVYQNLLKAKELKLSQSRKNVIIERLMFSHLDVYKKEDEKMKAFIQYFIILIKTTLKNPGFLFSREFRITLKSAKNIVA